VPRETAALSPLEKECRFTFFDGLPPEKAEYAAFSMRAVFFDPQKAQE
jgi:hypothetical protein